MLDAIYSRYLYLSADGSRSQKITRSEVATSDRVVRQLLLGRPVKVAVVGANDCRGDGSVNSY